MKFFFILKVQPSADIGLKFDLSWPVLGGYILLTRIFSNHNFWQMFCLHLLDFPLFINSNLQQKCASSYVPYILLFILTLRKLLLFGLLLYFDSFMYLHTDLVKHGYFSQRNEKCHTFPVRRKILSFEVNRKVTAKELFGHPNKKLYISKLHLAKRIAIAARKRK